MDKIQSLLAPFYGAESPYRWWCFGLTFLLILTFIKPTKAKAIPAFWIVVGVMAVVFGGQFIMKSNAPVDVEDSETGRATKRAKSGSFHSRFSSH
jgi:hypothetical protein